MTTTELRRLGYLLSKLRTVNVPEHTRSYQTFAEVKTSMRQMVEKGRAEDEVTRDLAPLIEERVASDRGETLTGSYKRRLAALQPATQSIAEGAGEP